MSEECPDGIHESCGCAIIARLRAENAEMKVRLGAMEITGIREIPSAAALFARAEAAEAKVAALAAKVKELELRVKEANGNEQMWKRSFDKMASDEEDSQEQLKAAENLLGGYRVELAVMRLAVVVLLGALTVVIIAGGPS